MDSNKILEDLDNQNFNIDSIKLQIILLKYLIRSDIKQDFILRRQIEIKEILQGKTGQELEEAVSLKFSSLFEIIEQEYSAEYHSQIGKVVS